jgi:hypothetical protein
MPLSNVQIRECLRVAGAFISKRRPPPEIRDKVDYRADIRGSEVTIALVRPAYDDRTRMVEHPFAKAWWIGTKKVWRLYWMRADMRWHSYQPMPEALTLDAVLAEVDRDPHCCFFG